MAKVKWILEQYPSARGDDRIMILMYLRIFEQHLVYNEATQKIELKNKEGLTYDEWRNISSFETLTRARRKLQEQFKDLLPSELVKAKRNAREKAIRENIRTITLNKQEYDKL